MSLIGETCVVVCNVKLDGDHDWPGTGGTSPPSPHLRRLTGRFDVGHEPVNGVTHINPRQAFLHPIYVGIHCNWNC